MVPIALAVWGETIKNRDVIFFLDNNSSKDALVRGISSSFASSMLVKASRLACARHAIAAWFDRVPSPSNLADDPSRGQCEVLLGMGATRVRAISLPDLGVFVSELD